MNGPYYTDGPVRTLAAAQVAALTAHIRADELADQWYFREAAAVLLACVDSLGADLVRGGLGRDCDATRDWRGLQLSLGLAKRAQAMTQHADEWYGVSCVA